MTASIPYLVEYYKRNSILIEINSVNIPKNIDGKNVNIGDIIGKIASNSENIDISLNYSSNLEISQIYISNYSNQRKTDVELIIPSPAVIVEHNPKLLNRYFRNRIPSGARVVERKATKIVVPPLDPNNMLIYTVFSTDVFSVGKTIPYALVNGNLTDINDLRIEDDVFGIKNFAKNYEFLVLIFIVSAILLYIFFAIVIYINYLRINNYDKYYKTVSADALDQARKLVDYNNKLRQEGIE